MFFASIRSIWRLYRGQRPRPSDLDTIVRKLRKRQGRKRQTSSSSRSNIVPRMDPNKMAERMRKFQLRKLKNTVEYVYTYTPYYRHQMDRMGVKPSDIKSLDDVRKLPITYRNTLQQHRDEYISQKPGLSVFQEFKTSGTTSEKLVMYLCEDEFHFYAASEAIIGLLSESMGPSTIYQVHLPLETSSAAIISTRAARMAGSLVINYGLTGSLEEHVKSIFKDRTIPGKDNKVSLLFASPAYLWILTQKAEDMGMEFKQSGLKQIMTGGAMVTKELKDRVKETWGIQLREGYAMVEAPAVGATECPEGRMHFIDVTGYIEVLDPETKEPVSDGDEGILVITEFYPEKEMMPLLRYWTQDLVIAGSKELCPCGTPTSYIMDILGRADQSIIFGGTNFNPQEIGDSLLGIPGLVLPPRFKVSIKEDENGQSANVDIESFEQLSISELNKLKKNVEEKIIFASSPFHKFGVVGINVNILPAGTIKEPFSYKHLGPDLSSLQEPLTTN